MNTHLKNFAILWWPSKSLYIAFSGGLTRNQTPKMATVETDAAGNPIDEFNAGNEGTLSGTPTGFLDAARLAALYPYATGAVPLGADAYSDDAMVVYQSNGTATTYYNCAIKTEPPLIIGVDKTGCFGGMEIGFLAAAGGDYAGLVDAVETGVDMPVLSFLDAATLFRAAPLVSWFANRTTGAVAATGTLTSDATAPADGDTVTIGGTVYTFKTALTPAAYEVLIGGSAANALSNLKKAVNVTGVAGANYAAGTRRHPTVAAGALTSTTLVVTAYVPGTAGNAIATTEASSHLSWGAATLATGADADGADNAFAYHLGGDSDEAGWYGLETVGGVTITPKVKLGMIASGSRGIGTYTVDSIDCEVAFQPLYLSEPAFNAAKNWTPGSSVAKGDVKITAGALTAILTRGAFAGGTLTNSREALMINPVTIKATSIFPGGMSIPALSLAWNP